MDTYTIYRYYRDPNLPRRVIATNLTAKQAKDHCSSPETSSKTCTTTEALAETEKYGPWFDGKEPE